MLIRLESVKRIGRKIGLDEEKSFTVTIFLVLLIVSATFVGYYIWLRPEAEAYNTIYLLDANKKAINYPETLVANLNSTFSVYVVVENHMTDEAEYQVQVKITNNLSKFPVDITPVQVHETSSVKSGANWEKMATITQKEAGSHSVVFELYEHKTGGTLEFKENYCVLNIQVIS